MNFKNNKGFTLIELLAVIVVLGIIMVIALNSVLPLIDDARVGGFVSTANNIVEAARTAKLADDLIGGGNTSCYTVAQLISEDRLERISASDYEGKVVINSSGNYVITLRDLNYPYGINAYDHTANGTLEAEKEVPAGTKVVIEDQTAIDALNVTCP